MLSFNFALEGPSIPSVAEDREYQSHFSMKRIPKKNIANNAPSNFIFNETFFFLMRFFDYAFEGPSIALDDDDDDDDYKSHFEKPYQKKYTTSSGRGQSSKRRGTTRGRK